MAAPSFAPVASISFLRKAQELLQGVLLTLETRVELCPFTPSTRPQGSQLEPRLPGLGLGDLASSVRKDNSNARGVEHVLRFAHSPGQRRHRHQRSRSP